LVNRGKNGSFRSTMSRGEKHNSGMRGGTLQGRGKHYNVTLEWLGFGGQELHKQRWEGKRREDNEKRQTGNETSAGEVDGNRGCKRKSTNEGAKGWQRRRGKPSLGKAQDFRTVRLKQRKGTEWNQKRKDTVKRSPVQQELLKKSSKGAIVKVDRNNLSERERGARHYRRRTTNFILPDERQRG